MFTNITNPDPFVIKNQIPSKIPKISYSFKRKQIFKTFCFIQNKSILLNFTYKQVLSELYLISLLD